MSFRRLVRDIHIAYRLHVALRTGPLRRRELRAALPEYTRRQVCDALHGMCRGGRVARTGPWYYLPAHARLGSVYALPDAPGPLVQSTSRASRVAHHAARAGSPA